MAARVQVIVEAKDAYSGVLRGITTQLGGLGRLIEDVTGSNINWGNVAASAAQIVVSGLKESIKATQDYAAEVRDLALVSGTTTEEASRLLQVLDDFEISAGDVTAATKALTREGLAPTVETIAQLADQYVALNGAQERNEFILKNLGRGGIQWANALSKGGDALRSLSLSVDEALILTEQNIQATEEYRLNIDQWNDSVLALQVSIGNALIPVLNEMLNTIEDNARAVEILKAAGEDAAANQLAALGQATNDVTRAALAQATAERVAADAIKAVADAAAEAAPNYSSMLSMMERLNGATREQIKLAAYQDLKQQLTASGGGLTADEAEILRQAGVALGAFDQAAANAAENISELNAEFIAGQTPLLTYIALLNDIPTNINTNLTTSGGSSYGGGCFIAGTLIEMADGSQKPIEDVEPGDAVVSMDLTQGTLTLGRVVDTSEHNADEYLLINGIGVTSEHPFYSQGAWVKAGALKIGSPLLGIGGAEKVESIEIVNRSVTVYNFEVEGHHNYFAGGILVHNKQSFNQAGGQVYANQPYTVGERGAEPFIPEQNGRILGHAESLHALGMSSGGGGTNNFYGNVTLSIGEGDAAGLGVRI